LTTWSSLEAGNRKAPEIDKTYCLKIAEDSQKLSILQTRDFYKRHPEVQNFYKDFYSKHAELSRPEPTVLSAADFCAQVPDKRYLILYQQAATSRLLSDFRASESPDERELENTIAIDLLDYEATRDGAFRIDLKLASGYSENDIEANALSVAAAVPFVVAGLLVLYFMLGHQEEGWTNLLRLELDRQSSGKSATSDLFAGKSQYFVSPRNRVGGLGLPGFLRSPDKFAKTALVLSTLYLLVTVTAEFADDVGGFTDSIFGGYSFWLYAAVFSAVMIIVVSRRYYSAPGPRPPNGRRVILPDSSAGNAGRPVVLQRIICLIRRPMIFIFVGAALASLFVPWAYRNEGGGIFGYEWLLRHDPGNHWIGAAGQAMDIGVFRDVRLEILIALTFLALCAICEVRTSWRGTRVGSLARILRNLAAVLVLFLSINYLLFMGILQTEAGTFYNAFYAQQGSMFYYNPAFGYWVFTALCVVLSVLSLSGQDSVS
jgi:hypothetical protein